MTTAVYNSRNVISEKILPWHRTGDYAKQTQFTGQPNEHNLLFNKALWQFSPPRTQQKQTQSNPNKANPTSVFGPKIGFTRSE
jgi:hypothetical protein